MFGEGKVAVVTGVGPDVGRSVALGFARHGVDVVIAARQAARLDSVAEEIRSLGREPLAVPTDIARREACEHLIAAAVDRFGGVDFLVQNAHHEGDWKPVVEADLDSWRAIFDVNLYGALHLVKAALAGMARTLAVELGPSGIRVNGLLLGGVAGENIRHAAQWQAAAAGITPEEWFDRRKASLPLRYMPTPDHCAGPCCSCARRWPRP